MIDKIKAFYILALTNAETKAGERGKLP
jgi:hypothetical protein